MAREVETAFKNYLTSAGVHFHQAVSREQGFTFNGSNLSVKIDVQPDLRFSYENMTNSSAPSKLPRQRKDLSGEELTDALLRIVHKDL